jgi:hypothetical protein
MRKHRKLGENPSTRDDMRHLGFLRFIGFQTTYLVVLAMELY